MPIHVVSQGETPYSIASAYGVSVDRLLYDNQLDPIAPLTPGQALLVLIPSIIHAIGAGETLQEIATAYQTTITEILRNNPYLISSGYGFETIPTGTSIVIRYEDEKQGSARFGGYAYPFIQTELLHETLLYLSELYIFSYGFTTEGALIPTEDDYLLAAVATSNEQTGTQTVPILTLTPLDATGAFNNNLVHVIATNPEAQNRLIAELTETLTRKGYAGVDIDFEYIMAEDREGYASFVTQVAEQLRPLGMRTSVALAPKERADWPGLLYEGIDYPALGAAADQVLLMTYEWGYTYGPPMAIAPINRVRAVVDYGVSAIPREKVNLGIPNYAYDWALPYERGVTAAANISNVEATRRAALYGVPIRFDETAQSPYYEYTENGTDHIVWFEDVRSIQAKYRLLREYRLQGAVYWNLMKPFRANWFLLNSEFQILP